MFVLWEAIHPMGNKRVLKICISPYMIVGMVDLRACQIDIRTYGGVLKKSRGTTNNTRYLQIQPHTSRVPISVDTRKINRPASESSNGMM